MCATRPSASRGRQPSGLPGLVHRGPAPPAAEHTEALALCCLGHRGPGRASLKLARGERQGWGWSPPPPAGKSSSKLP